MTAKYYPECAPDVPLSSVEGLSTDRLFAAEADAIKHGNHLRFVAVAAEMQARRSRQYRAVGVQPFADPLTLALGAIEELKAKVERLKAETATAEAEAATAKSSAEEWKKVAQDAASEANARAAREEELKAERDHLRKEAEASDWHSERDASKAAELAAERDQLKGELDRVKSELQALAAFRPKPLLCVRHGGSPACEEHNRKYSLACPKCIGDTIRLLQTL